MLLCVPVGAGSGMQQLQRIDSPLWPCWHRWTSHPTAWTHTQTGCWTGPARWAAWNRLILVMMLASQWHVVTRRRKPLLFVYRCRPSSKTPFLTWDKPSNGCAWCCGQMHGAAGLLSHVLLTCCSWSSSCRSALYMSSSLHLHMHHNHAA